MDWGEIKMIRCGEASAVRLPFLYLLKKYVHSRVEVLRQENSIVLFDAGVLNLRTTGFEDVAACGFEVRQNEKSV
jgi:hypothetical protein